MYQNRPQKKNTLILDQNTKSDINVAAAIIKNGGIVAIPTETVYGLAGKGLCGNSLRKIYEAKNRPLKNPLILHVAHKEQALKLFDFSFDHEGKVLKRFLALSKFWPGALTIISKKSAAIPQEVSFGLDTVAVRIPNHAAALEVISLVGEPLAMPSANLSTRPSSTSCAHVLQTLNGRIDAVMDGGTCQLGIESTVVSIEKEDVYIYRLGMVSKNDIEKALNETVLLSLTNEEKPLSPGQSFLHYSPKVSLIKTLNYSALQNHWHSDDSILLTNSQFEQAQFSFKKRPKSSNTVILSDDPVLYVEKFYSALYSFENYPTKKLFLVLPEGEGDLWAAMREKMQKASTSIN